MLCWNFCVDRTETNCVLIVPFHFYSTIRNFKHNFPQIFKLSPCQAMPLKWQYDKRQQNFCARVWDSLRGNICYILPYLVCVLWASCACYLEKPWPLGRPDYISSFDIKWSIHTGVVNLFKDTLGCLYWAFDWERFPPVTFQNFQPNLFFTLLEYNTTVTLTGLGVLSSTTLGCCEWLSGFVFANVF